MGLGEATPLTSFPKASNARSNFLAELIGTKTETFEDSSPGSGAPLDIEFRGTSQNITSTLTGNGEVSNVTPGTTNGFGRYATSEAQYWESSDDFSVDFSKPVSAFGFNGIDIGDFGAQVTATTEGGLDNLAVIGFRSHDPIYWITRIYYNGILAGDP